MPSYHNAKLAVLLAGGALWLPMAAQAQQIGYGSTDGYSSPMPSSSTAAPAEAEQDTADAAAPKSRRRIEFHPYIEAGQVVTAQLSPGNDVLTYSRLAVGADGQINGRNNQGAVSVRYEHAFGWGKNARDYDQISGIARVSSRVAPGVRIEAGALASQTNLESGLINGASLDRKSRVYSVFGGPTVEGKAGPVNLKATYRIGYSETNALDAVVTGAGTTVDVKEHALSHNATARAGIDPGDVLPVGVALIGTYAREDISTLKQRQEDATVRGEVLVPLTSQLAAVGSVGYEKVEVSSRDAARDANGNPIIDSSGRYVVDSASPRRIAFETSGLIWDAGVIWRPSRRTNLEARIGHRYGSMTYFGSFSYAPSARSRMSLSVYDRLSTFGGGLTSALEALPTEFIANRDPITGAMNGCVDTTQGNNCFANALMASRRTAYRARGVALNYGLDLGRITAGLGFGYDRRKLIAAPGTILEGLNGQIDENYWMAAYMGAKLSRTDMVNARAYANRQSVEGVPYGDARNVGASVMYGHLWTQRLSTSVGLGIEGLMRDDPAFADIWNASALASLRYTF